jgi:hypothetical protein
MARKSINYKVTDEGRDKGKVFVLTEMSAAQAEKWAMKALLAVISSGVDLPPGFESMGMAGMAEVGIKALAGLRWEIAEPLLDEMWGCVQVMPSTDKPHVIRPLIDQDIEEIITRIKIRAEIWKLHIDFLKAVAPLVSAKPQAAANGQSIGT